MAKILSLIATLVAYSDTSLGVWLRGKMILPVHLVDSDLAAYIVYAVHF